MACNRYREPDSARVAILRRNDRHGSCRCDIRFYAGAPFRAATGEVLGVLCVIDSKPRPEGLTQRQADSLRTLSDQVSKQLDLRKALAERDAFLLDQHRAQFRRNGLLNLGDRLHDLRTVGEMMQAASTIVGETLDVSRAGFGRLDESAQYITVEPDWTAEGVVSVAGRHRLTDYENIKDSVVRGDHLIIEDVLSDARTSSNPQPFLDLGIRAMIKTPVREHGRTVAVLFVHDQQPRIWSPGIVLFLRNIADRIEVSVARLRAEADQRVLNRELSHRMKNTFAMIQAIASQTLHPIPDQEPVNAFMQRLHALSSAHEVLLQENFAEAELESVVRTVLKPLALQERFEIKGPLVGLGARATLAVSLLLHELTTNALKYGAFSTQGGHIAIQWRLDGPEEKVELILEWRESGGPPVEEPKRRGFGSRLIRLGLAGTGGVELRFHNSGLEAEFRAPLALVQLP